MNKFVLFIVFLFFIVGLSFHYDQSYFDFGEILLPNQFSIRSHFCFVLSQLLLVYFLLCGKFKDFEFSLFLIFLIFLPSIYVYRFGVYDEITVSIFVLTIIIRDGISNFRISYFNLILIFFLLFSSIVGLFYSIKSFRYIFQVFSIFLLVFYVNSNKSFFLSNLFVKLLSICSVFYYLFVFIAFLITATNASFLNLYLYGLGYAPTTIVNLPSILIVPLLTFGYIRGNLNYREFILPILFGLGITILSDSRTGFFPYLMCLPFAVFKIGLKNSFILFFYIFTSAYLIGLYQFSNPWWIYDTFSSLLDIFNIGGTTQITYYGHSYDSASGDTGRFIYIFSPFLFYLNNPFFLFTGVGNYGFFEHNYIYIVQLSKYFNTSLDIVTSGLIIGGKSSIPRPPTFPSFLIEYGILFTFYVYYILVKKIVKTRSNYFFFSFHIVLFSLTFFIEIHESLLFYFLLFNTKNHINGVKFL